MELRGKVEKELDDNPLLRNLGVTIHGSVHDAKQAKTNPERKPPHASVQN